MEAFFRHRHPELVSGSISSHARSYRFEAQTRCKIVPVRVATLNQIDLPLPVPALELLFPLDSIDHIAEHFEADEMDDSVTAGKTFDSTRSVLVKSSHQIGSDTDIECSVGLARKDVDAGLLFLPHGPVRADKWMLKQVQHDEILVEPMSHRHAELVLGSILPQALSCASEQGGYTVNPF